MDGIPSLAAEDEEVQTDEQSAPSILASKWFGFVSAIWVQAISGNNYTFANYAVELKAILGINQVRLNSLSSAKDVGKGFGIVAGFLSGYLPPWTILLIGSLEGMVGYGAQWLVISRKIKPLPFWTMCVVLCMGGHSTTWMNTAVLVTCVRNFRRSRGPVSGILKAYVGLSTAIFTDLCTALFAGDAAAFVLMLALIPLGVCVVAMFLLRPVECDLNVDGEREELRCFSVLNSVAIVLAFYLLAYDLSGLKRALFSRLIAGGLCIVLVAPVVLPIYLHVKVARWRTRSTLNDSSVKQIGQKLRGTLHRDVERVPGTTGQAMIQRGEGETQGEMMVHRDVEVSITKGEMMGHGGAKGMFTTKRGGMARRDVLEVSMIHGEALVHGDAEVVSTIEGKVTIGREAWNVSPAEGEAMTHRGAEVSTPEAEVSKNRDTEVVNFTTKGRDAKKVLLTEGEAFVQGDVEVLMTEERQGGFNKRKKIGNEFTVLESMKTADFWLLFICFFCGVGPGMTVINNMGQIGQSMGYSSVSIFVSLISIWGFFGRLGSGVLSEYLIRCKAVPRPVLLAVSQLVMMLGYLLLALGAAGSLYIGSIVIGVCYGVRLSVSVPVISEMFGLKAFGLMYNLLILNLPLGSVLLSSLLAGFLYDHEAAKDGSSAMCLGAHCYRLVFLIMALVSGMGFVLDCILALRTRALYQQIYSTKLT